MARQLGLEKGRCASAHDESTIWWPCDVSVCKRGGTILGAFLCQIECVCLTAGCSHLVSRASRIFPHF